MVELEEDYKAKNGDHSDTDLMSEGRLAKLRPLRARDLQATKCERTSQSYLI